MSLIELYITFALLRWFESTLPPRQYWCDSYTYILKDSVSSGIMFINTNQLSSKTINTIQPASDNMICLAVAKEGLLNIQKT